MHKASNSQEQPKTKTQRSPMAQMEALGGWYGPEKTKEQKDKSKKKIR